MSIKNLLRVNGFIRLLNYVKDLIRNKNMPYNERRDPRGF